MKIRVYTDGASRGNPGCGGIGVVVRSDGGNVLEEFCEYVGKCTNNVAEYKGLIAGLKLAKKYSPSSVSLHLDSELVVLQIKGKYRVKDETLKAYHEFARELISGLEDFSINYIPRESNKEADILANRAIDTAKRQ